jgi:hypothetical protein
MATYRELDGLRGFTKTGAVHTHAASAGHDAACLTPLFGEMAAAMLTGPDRVRQ